MNIPIDLPHETPLQVARRTYVRWKSSVPLNVDVEKYLMDPNGIVISTPDIFALAKVEHSALFVRVAVGNLRTLLNALPVRPARIRFYRRNGSQLKEWDLAKLLQTTDKIMKRRT